MVLKKKNSPLFKLLHTCPRTVFHATVQQNECTVLFHNINQTNTHQLIL